MSWCVICITPNFAEGRDIIAIWTLPSVNTGKEAAPSPFRSISFKSVSSCTTRMGRTIPSFRIASEMERAKWRDFRSLLNLKERKMFDQMFSYVRFYNSACKMQASPVVFHSVTMSVLFHHYKQLMELTGKKKKAKPTEWPSRFQTPPWQAKLENWMSRRYE